MKSYQIFIITLAILVIACNPTQSLSSFSTPNVSQTIQPTVTPSSVLSPTIVINMIPTVPLTTSLSDLIVNYPVFASEFETDLTRTLKTRVFNGGDSPSQPTTVEFWKGNLKQEVTRIGTVTSPALEAGHSTLITMTWNIQQQGGRYFFYAIVDPENVVAESDESNNVSEYGLFESVPSVILKVNTSSSEYDYGATVPITITAINNTPSLSNLSLIIQRWIRDEGNRDIENQVQTLEIPSGISEGSITTTWQAEDSDPGNYALRVMSAGPDIAPGVPEVWGTRTEFQILEDPTVDNTDRRIVKEIFGPVVSTRYEQHKVKAISCAGMPLDHCIVNVEVFSKIGQLTELEELKLSGIYNLTTLPPEIGQLSKLKTMWIAAPVTNLPPEIGNLTNLTELVVSYGLSELPPEIGKLTNLTVLDLNRNQLTTLPPEIKNLTKLTRLVLSGNRLTTLPPEIGNLSNLEDFYLSENQLTILPPEIWNLSNLTYLSLGKNPLTSLPSEIGKLTKLEILDIDEDQLTTLPSEIGNFSSLIYLHLGKNQLTSLPSEIGNLTKLKLLDLEGNQLTALPPEIIQLKNLTVLYLSNNNFTVRPPELDQMPNLETIHIEGNPFNEEGN